MWTDSDVETFGLENREAYDAAGNFGEKSDILRYEVCGCSVTCGSVSFIRYKVLRGAKGAGIVHPRVVCRDFRCSTSLIAFIILMLREQIMPSTRFGAPSGDAFGQGHLVAEDHPC